jgi:uncharacterized membrane-anchored protein YhcB (DUF1043 family)
MIWILIFVIIIIGLYIGIVRIQVLSLKDELKAEQKFARDLESDYKDREFLKKYILKTSQTLNDIVKEINNL